mmetsp:Transcript_94955/g.264127  ORF Transcript_94955/g.264127 Transcript_94955/m.264127 type:complete len:226 (-) Transcript_94955:812-1489(-)
MASLNVKVTTVERATSVAPFLGSILCISIAGGTVSPTLKVYSPGSTPRKGTSLWSTTVPGPTNSWHSRTFWPLEVPLKLFASKINKLPWAITCWRGKGSVLAFPEHWKNTDSRLASMKMSRSKVAVMRMSEGVRSCEPAAGANFSTTGGLHCGCSAHMLQGVRPFSPRSSHLPTSSSQRQSFGDAAQAQGALRVLHVAAGQCSCVLQSSQEMPSSEAPGMQRMTV